MAIDVRPATITDADAIAAAHIEGWRVGYRHLLPDDYLDSDDFAEVRIAGWRRWTWGEWAPAGSVLFAGLVDDHVVGFAHAGTSHDDGEVGEVYGFYVHPTAWGTGVADTLMDRSLHHLDGAGFRTAVLWVLADNPRARRFYERWGWQVTDRTDVMTSVYGRELPEPLHEVQYARSLG